MVRGSSNKRKRPLATDSESDFIASPTRNPNRIGWEESPLTNDTAQAKTKRVCSISDAIAPSKRQITLHSFFAKKAKPRPKQNDDENNNGKEKENTSNRNTSSAPTKSKTKSLTQFYLDCGQKQFGQTVCQKCGMLYVPGVAEDETEHKKMCEAVGLGIPCHRGVVKGGKKLNVNQQTSIVSWRPGLKTSDANVPSQWPLLAKMISKDLGILEETTLDHLRRHIVFLYVSKDGSKHRILGAATCQLLGKVPAYKMMSSCERSLEPIPAKLGIGLLWTHPSKRKQGIATQLVNAAREHSCFGIRISKQDLAFSNPTQAGYSFAQRYGQDQPLVYEMAL